MKDTPRTRQSRGMEVTVLVRMVRRNSIVKEPMPSACSSSIHFRTSALNRNHGAR